MEVKLFVSGVTLLTLLVTGSNAQADVCGIAPRNPKIVGGQEAPVGAWPWMASLQFGGHLLCGGTLINSEWVMTAAQCIVSVTPSSYTVYLGRHTQKGPNPNEVSRSVTKIVVHPRFNSKTFDNDIALLKLSSNVTFTDYIRPVCLAASNSEYSAGRECWVTGWGSLKTGAPAPDPGTLQEVVVPIVSNSDCNSVFGSITNNMMCAGTSQGGKGTCNGDAGGPLMRKMDSKWVQGGVTSFVSASGCAEPKVPSGYARVSQYESWIKTQIPTNQPGFVLAGTSQLVSLSLPLLLSVVLGLFWV